MTSQQTVTVLGAGVVGVATAIALQRAGFAVTLVDRGEPGRGTSYGNAGILGTSAATPLATPGILRQVPGMLMNPLGPLTIRWSYLPQLAPWLIRFIRAAAPGRVEELTTAIVALSKSSLGAWLDLADHAGAMDLIERRGWIGVHESEDSLKKAAAEVETRRRHGIRVEMIGANEVRQLAPALARTVVGAVYHPDTGHTVDPYRLTERMARHLMATGAIYHRATVKDIVVTDGKAVGLATEDRVLSFDRLVIAAGAWSKPLAARLGHRVPLDTERGYHVMIADPGVELRLPVLSSEGKFFLTPMAGGIRVAGTVELAGLKAPPDWRRADILLQHGKRLMPDMKTDKVERWMGFRPTLPDSLPVIGGSPHHDNVFFAFGHHHLGLTHSAITGKLIAELMTGQTPSIDLTPYRIDRF